MSSSPKAQAQFDTSATEQQYADSNYQESQTQTLSAEPQKTGAGRLLESIRLGLTLLALLISITIVGTSGDTLMVYNNTTLASEFYLSIWPTDFDLRPTVALVICGAIVVLISAISLAVSKIPATRNRTLLHYAVSFLTPLISLIAALIGTSFFYGINSSKSVYTLQAWSCQWSSVGMDIKPYWGTLCKESKVALYLTVLLVPIQVVILSTAAFGAITEKKRLVVRERKGSPAMS